MVGKGNAFTELAVIRARGSVGHVEDRVFAGVISVTFEIAIARQKDLLNKKLYADLSDWMEEERESMSACSRTEDFKEAVYAFLDKREPRFRGK